MAEKAENKVTPIRPGVKIQNKKTASKTKNYRSGADWETLEYYYRIGWSLKDIAALDEAAGITSQAIANRIRRYKWTRNLESRVADTARAMMLGSQIDGKPTKEALDMLRGDKKHEDEIVLTAAGEVAARLKVIRDRVKRLDDIINRSTVLAEQQLEKIEEELQDESREKAARVDYGRLMKSVSQLTATIAKANEQEGNYRDLTNLVKTRENIKPMLVKPRAIIDDSEVGGVDYGEEE